MKAWMSFSGRSVPKLKWSSWLNSLYCALHAKRMSWKHSLTINMQNSFRKIMCSKFSGNLKSFGVCLITCSTCCIYLLLLRALVFHSSVLIFTCSSILVFYVQSYFYMFLCLLYIALLRFRVSSPALILYAL